MLNQIIYLENLYEIKGYKEYGETIRSYHCKPTDDLEYFLNIFTNDYYDFYDNIDSVTLEITPEYDLFVSAWNEDDQINDAVLIRTQGNLKFYELLFKQIEMED